MVVESRRDGVSRFRMVALRGAYLLLVFGLGPGVWMDVLFRSEAPPLMDGVVDSILAAVSLLAVLGVFRPLEMLPLLIFETVWKAIWLLSIALPLTLHSTLDADTASVAFACAMGVIFPIVIPWRVVFDRYGRRRVAVRQGL